MRKTCAKSCQAEPTCALRPVWPVDWPGHATEAATRLYALQGPGVAGKAHADFFRRDVSMGSYLLPNQKVRGPGWLMLGSLGSGTYLGNEDEETDERVACGIIAGIGHGWNVIDTASNYRNGRAELAVGRALRAVRASPFIEREMLFVSTKAGFVAEHLLKGLRSAGTIQDSDMAAGSHCIAPACLRASLTQSLTSLNLQTVDLLYLHNAAEMQLGPLGKQGFRQLLGEAFRALEELRSEGKIRAYGMATWDCFRLPPDSPSHVSLQEVVALAKDIGGLDHGFRYVQLPINAAMPEAWRERWQSMPTRTLHDDGRLDVATAVETVMGSLMEAAARLGVGVFASGPLQEGQLLGDRHLQDLVHQVPDLVEEGEFATQLLQIARSTPLLTASLVGMKTRDHTDANLKLTAYAPLNSSQFANLHHFWEVSAV
ncbi:hypothetical protein WJX84_010934 [Apatococcus fuscideae]